MDLLDMGQTLGRGAYGKVFKGRLKLGSDLRVEVSTKSIHENWQADERRTYLWLLAIG